MRIKGGVTTKRRHKKILKLAKGYRLGRSKLFRQAKEAVYKAYKYAYRDRRVKKREFRKLWIIKINAALRNLGTTYKDFIHALRQQKKALNRKMLAYLAEKEPEAFAKLVEEVQNQQEDKKA